jgi:nicotinamidase-related amidase
MEWKKCALLLIDIQNDFVNDLAIGNQRDTYTNNIKELIEVCRKKEIEVIHIRGKFKSDGSDWMNFQIYNDHPVLIENTDGFLHGEYVNEIQNEKVFYKKTLDAFINGELEKYLNENGKKFLFIAGLETAICVLLTTMHAIQIGFWTCIIKDCVWDDSPNHENVLEMYKNIIINIIEHNEIENIEKQKQWDLMIDGKARRSK